MSRKVSIFRQDPWLKQPTETVNEFKLFEIYLGTPAHSRSECLPALAANFNLTQDAIEEMADRHNWSSRVIRYDTYQTSIRKQVAMMSRDEAGAKMVGLSKQVIDLAKKSLEWLDENNKHPSYREAVEMIRVAIELNKNGLALQGVSPGTDLLSQSDGNSPTDLIEAAVQVNMIIRRRAETVEVTQDDRIIDNPEPEPEAIQE